MGLQREMLITGSANAFKKEKKTILCPILSQYVLIKEVGLNIEKNKRKKSQGIQYNKKLPVTFCFGPHLPIWYFSPWNGF